MQSLPTNLKHGVLTPAPIRENIGLMASGLQQQIPRIAEDYYLSVTPQLSRPLELHCMEQDYS